MPIYGMFKLGGMCMVKIIDVENVVGKSIFDDRMIMKSHNAGLLIMIDKMGRIFDETWRYIADGKMVEPGTGVGSGTYVRKVKFKRKKASDK